MVRSKGRAATEHAATTVYGYVREGRVVGGSHGGKMTARGERTATRRRQTSPGWL